LTPQIEERSSDTSTSFYRITRRNIEELRYPQTIPGHVTRYTQSRFAFHLSRLELAPVMFRAQTDRRTASFLWRPDYSPCFSFVRTLLRRSTRGRKLFSARDITTALLSHLHYYEVKLSRVSVQKWDLIASHHINTCPDQSELLWMWRSFRWYPVWIPARLWRSYSCFPQSMYGHFWRFTYIYFTFSHRSLRSLSCGI
jgi:hypothetical protein